MSLPLIHRKLGSILVVLVLPLLLGAWQLTTGPSINPRYVARIQDGKTKKHEILTWFGDPQEINRLPEGVSYVYKTFRPKNELPRRKIGEPKRTLSSLDPNALDKQVSPRETVKEDDDKELASTLVIRFKPDGETVQSHDYQQF